MIPVRLIGLGIFALGIFFFRDQIKDKLPK